MRRLFLFSDGFLIAYTIAYSLLAASRPVEGVTTIRLAKCKLDVYDKTLQPRVTVALACPGDRLYENMAASGGAAMV
jgi:hypothetical protein